MLCQEASVVEYLSQKVDRMLTWVSINSLVGLVREILSASSCGGLSASDASILSQLQARVEARVIELIQEESRHIADDWEMGSASPNGMRFRREEFRASAKGAPTAKIRKEFHAAANKIQYLLDKGSEELANHQISSIERAIACAEEILANQRFEDASCAQANLDGAQSDIAGLQQIPHLAHVGLPRVARKRNVSAEELIQGFRKRLDDADDALDILYRKLMERERATYEKELEQARLAYQRQQAGLQLARQKQSVEEAVAELARRNKELGEIARRFLENIKLGNKGAVDACKHDIIRRDGGIPVPLQEEYYRFLRRQG